VVDMWLWHSVTMPFIEISTLSLSFILFSHALLRATSTSPTYSFMYDAATCCCENFSSYPTSTHAFTTRCLLLPFYLLRASSCHDILVGRKGRRHSGGASNICGGPDKLRTLLKLLGIQGQVDSHHHEDNVDTEQEEGCPR